MKDRPVMPAPILAYADTSFLARIYTLHADSEKALRWLQNAAVSLPFTPFHRHELRNAVRLRVFRGEITIDQRKLAFQEIESDLADNILAHTPIPWTDVFRECETLATSHTEKLGVRSFDLLHVGLALTMKATEFLTYDARQASLAKLAGLKLRP
jgi:predicted nucleic acid-binding protein